MDQPLALTQSIPKEPFEDIVKMLHITKSFKVKYSKNYLESLNNLTILLQMCLYSWTNLDENTLVIQASLVNELLTFPDIKNSVVAFIECFSSMSALKLSNLNLLVTKASTLFLSLNNLKIAELTIDHVYH